MSRQHFFVTVVLSLTGPSFFTTVVSHCSFGATTTEAGGFGCGLTTTVCGGRGAGSTTTVSAKDPAGTPASGAEANRANMRILFIVQTPLEGFSSRPSRRSAEDTLGGVIRSRPACGAADEA